MTTITDDLPARLLHEEHAGWRALLAGTGGSHFRRAMTSDAVLIVPGAVFDRDQILHAFDDAPPWESYEIHEPRIIRLRERDGILTYRIVGRWADGREVEIQASTTYVIEGGDWRVAAHQQTPVG
ncbi:DUF4440 domain-containing protein [Microbacteriaceae bacterium VKM Ac-2855]|nr:DUF4440 domain-containing protein [Microbacteriaceae bacterium VKM Ac-2855]